MNKLLLILTVVSIVLVGCGNTGIKDGKFTFSEDEFQKTYEEKSDKLMPESVEVSDASVSVDFATKEEIIYVLKTLDDLVDDSKISNTINTFKEKGELNSSSEKMTMVITGDDDDDDYLASFILKDDESTQ